MRLTETKKLIPPTGYLKYKFCINSSFKCEWDLNYSDLNLTRSGSCYFATQYSAYLNRAMGIPVAVDFTPFWANKSGGHEWNALIVNGKSIPFIGTESDPGKTKIEFAFERKRAKIFRVTYAKQKNGIKDLKLNQNDIPGLFQNDHIKDVTSQYIPVSDVQIPLNKEYSKYKIAYLCVYNGQDWKPVNWGKIDDSGICHFKDMGRNIIYAPMCYLENEFFPAGIAFILNSDGKIDLLSGNTNERGDIKIARKSPNGTKIAKNNTYELFCWVQENGWFLLDKKKAEDDFIVFKNIPQNGLFRIHSNDNSKSERIFTYENGNQKWW